MGSQLQTRLSSTQDVLQACPTRCPLLLDLLLQQCQRGRHGGRRRHRPASVHAVEVERLSPSWHFMTSSPPPVSLLTSPILRHLDVFRVLWELTSWRHPLLVPKLWSFLLASQGSLA